MALSTGDLIRASDTWNNATMNHGPVYFILPDVQSVYPQVGAHGSFYDVCLSVGRLQYAAKRTAVWFLWLAKRGLPTQVGPQLVRGLLLLYKYRSGAQINNTP